MKYMLLMYADETIAPNFTPEFLQEVQQDWYAYLKEANAAGVLVANNGLLPVANSTTVRCRDGKTVIADGPFAETHEQLGGFSILDCKDIDEAIGWATRIPYAKYGSIEIRPLWTPD